MFLEPNSFSNLSEFCYVVVNEGSEGHVAFLTSFTSTSG